MIKITDHFSSSAYVATDFC